jgi:hypothetical protein
MTIPGRAKIANCSQIEKAITFSFKSFILESANNPGKELHERNQK